MPSGPMATEHCAPPSRAPEKWWHAAKSTVRLSRVPTDAPCPPPPSSTTVGMATRGREARAAASSAKRALRAGCAGSGPNQWPRKWTAEADAAVAQKTEAGATADAAAAAEAAQAARGLAPSMPALSRTDDSRDAWSSRKRGINDAASPPSVSAPAQRKRRRLPC